MTLVISPEGRRQEFTTIEQVRYWLRKRWPVADRDREHALRQVDAAMHCLTPVDAARKAFVSAARTAGFKLDEPGPEVRTTRR